MPKALKTKTITQKQIIKATQMEIFHALTDPKKHSAFTGAEATGKAKIGGKFTTWDGYIEGRHIDLQEGKRILRNGKPPVGLRAIRHRALNLRLRRKRTAQKL